MAVQVLFKALQYCSWLWLTEQTLVRELLKLDLRQFEFPVLDNLSWCSFSSSLLGRMGHLGQVPFKQVFFATFFSQVICFLGAFN